MAKSKSKIIDDIKGHIAKHDSGIGGWYVGIAARPRDRLFDDHSVDETNDSWIFRTASSSSVAREIEQYFLNKGARGGTGGGGVDSKAVYAYLINSHTRE